MATIRSFVPSSPQVRSPLDRACSLVQTPLIALAIVAAGDRVGDMQVRSILLTYQIIKAEQAHVIPSVPDATFPRS
jgi:hypothetical protein